MITRLYSRNADHPRRAFVPEADGTESVVVLDKVTKAFTVPFDPRIREVHITDRKLGRTDAEPVKLMVQDVGATVRQFCIDRPTDPNCTVE